MIKFLLSFGIFILLLFHSSSFSVAEPDCNNPGLGDIDYCIEKIREEYNARKPAHEVNKKELADLNNQISGLTKRIAKISNILTETEKEISGREEDLAYAKEVFNVKTDKHYRYLRLYDPITPFFSSSYASDILREVSYRLKAIDEDRKTMEDYVSDLVKLKNDKESLEKNKLNLAKVKSQVDERAKFLGEEVSKVEGYLQSLSAKQQQLTALKAGGFSTSIGDTPLTLEKCSGPKDSSNFCDPGFRPAFAAFSFGAPHRTGMSQYGAYGRAKSGQSAEDILSAYYQGATLNKSYSSPDTIGVTGYGRLSLEDNYLLGIHEIPESWGDTGGYEALKAQAVAARTYALAVTGNGAGSICTTESCQVYKPQLKGGKWAEAVRATRGWVLVKDGSPAKSYYASTSGGFTVSQWGWNAIVDTVGGSVDNWPSQAYEKIAGSPWFYKGWYKSRSGASCGRESPWLKGEEMADILNAWKVITQGGGDLGRVTPIDSGCWKGNPYTLSELQSIGGYTAVNSVSVYSKDGSTLSLNFDTNKGGVSVSGDELKKAFNLRAPGYIGIKSSLFNIENLK